MLLHDLPINAAILVSVFQEVWWHAGANNWPHKLTQRAEGRFQEICYRIGEPLGICRLQLHQELNGDVAA